MFSLLFLAACSTNPPSDILDVPGPHDSPEVDPMEGTIEGSDPGRSFDGRAMETSGGGFLVVTLEGESHGFVEVRAYRGAALEVNWIGVALHSAGIEGDETVSFAFPPVPPKRDGADKLEPIVYSVALRAPDAEGEPGAYIGIARPDLVWLPEGPDAGWHIVDGYGRSDAEWHPLSEGITLGQHLLGAPDVTLSGDSLFPVTPDTHIAVATDAEEGGVSVFDSPIGEEWEVNLAFAGRLVEAGDVDGAMLRIFAYLDEDGNNTWNDEPIVADACDGGRVVAASWFPQAYDLGAALALRDRNVPTGWGMHVVTEDRIDPLPFERMDELFLSESCIPGPPPEE